MSADTHVVGLERFQRIAAITALLAVPLSYLPMVMLMRAISFDFSVLGEPARLLTLGTSGAAVLKWVMVLDLVGQYLLYFPLVLFLWYWLRPRDPPLVTLLTIGGVVYIFIGALGVSINAVVLPDLITQYADAGPEQRAVLETTFGAFANAIMVGSWGVFVRLVGGIYWVGIGIFLKHEKRYAGYFTIVVGMFALLSTVGNVLQIVPLIGVGTLGYLLGFPAWALWLGIVLYRV